MNNIGLPLFDAVSRSEARESVLRAIQARGKAGLYDIMETLGWPSNRVSGRLTELQKQKRIEACGRKRTPLGATCQVWRVCD